MARRTRVELYRWLLTADPPICATGNPVAVLNQCELRRQGQVCWCRFDVVETATDLEDVGANDVIDWLNADLEAEDVSDLAEHLARAIRGLSADSEPVDRGNKLLRRLRRVAERGAGLSDAYVEEIDE